MRANLGWGPDAQAQKLVPSKRRKFRIEAKFDQQAELVAMGENREKILPNIGSE